MEQKQKKVLFFGIMKRKWNEEQEAYEAKKKREISERMTLGLVFSYKAIISLNPL